MLELEDDVLVRQLSVDGGEGIGLVLHILLTLSTKEHLDRLASLTAERRLLANALARIDQIVDDGSCTEVRVWLLGRTPLNL